MNSAWTRTAATMGCLVVLSAAMASAQALSPVAHRVALAPSGSIWGTVQDEMGSPVAGALVSVLGTTTASVLTDRGGRFEILTLTPGHYLVRAQRAGFVAL